MPSGFENKSFEEMKADNDIGWRYRQMAQTASRSNKGLYISIQGMYHSNFQDYALYPGDLIPENIRKKRLGPIDGTACLRLITRTLIIYFDATLKKGNKQTGERTFPVMQAGNLWRLNETLKMTSRFFNLIIITTVLINQVYSQEEKLAVQKGGWYPASLKLQQYQNGKFYGFTVAQQQLVYQKMSSFYGCLWPIAICDHTAWL